MLTVLITGVNGFVGGHLAKEFKSRNCTVYGVGLQSRASPRTTKVLDSYYSADLTDPNQVKKLPFSDIDIVINLAGLARVGDSFDQAEKYMKVNVAVIETVNRAILASGNKIRHIAISTGAVYDPSAPLPFSESSPLANDSSPYVTSKIAMEQMSDKYREMGLDLVIARPFNHIGPGQETGFLVPDLIAQVKQALAENTEIKVGNLDTKRDYTDVRDVVKAYALLASASTLNHPIYNVCSGRSIAGHKILDMILDRLAKDNRPEVIVDKTKFRPSDAPDIYGDCEILKQDTGWTPEISIEQTLDDILSV